MKRKKMNKQKWNKTKLIKEIIKLKIKIRIRILKNNIKILYHKIIIKIIELLLKVN